ncbi:UNVERIFIED_ORG: hypothetical protein J3D59_004194 [Pseudomonas fluorescens]
MTVISIMDTDLATLELIKHQRQWQRIKRNLNDAFEHWEILSKDYLKELLSLEPHNPKIPKLTGKVIEKSFTLILTPLLLDNIFLGKLIILSPKTGTKEETIIAEYLLDNSGNISTQKGGPKILRDETKNPNYTLLINILSEVLRH